MDMSALLQLLFMIYSTAYAAVGDPRWKSEIVPGVECACRRWVSTSNDTKWMNATYKDPNFQENGFDLCRYGVKIERKQCVKSGAATSNLRKCRENELIENKYFFLPKNTCLPKYERKIYEEKCDSQCQRRYRKIFRPCYKKRKTFLYCIVDWERCDTSICERQTEFQEYNVLIHNNCRRSSCTDGIAKGIRRYGTQCSNSSYYGGDKTDVPCNQSTYKGSKELVLRCDGLPPCNSPTSKMAPTTTTTTRDFIEPLPTLRPSRSKAPLPSVIDHSPTEDNRPITTSRRSTVTVSDVKVNLGGLNPFFVVMIIVGSILCLLIVGLLSTACYVVVCKERKRRIGIYDMLRMSRDSLERGYTRLSSFVFRRHTDTDKPQERSARNESEQNVKVEEESVDSHTIKNSKVDDEEGIYWAVSDKNGRNIRPYFMKRSESSNSSIVSTSGRSRHRMLPKMPESQSHNVFKFNEVKSPLLPPTGDHVRVVISTDEDFKKRGSCPSDWRSGVRMSTFLEDQPALKAQQTKESFDDIISEISTLRRDLSFITSRTKTDFSSSDGDGLHSIFSDSTSSDDSFSLPDISPVRSFSRSRADVALSSFGIPSSSRNPVSATSSSVCHVTSTTQQRPAISVFHPRDRGFGLIRDRDEHRMGKIVIDTTRAKLEMQNSSARTTGSRLSFDKTNHGKL